MIEERTLVCVCSVQRVARLVSSNTTQCECVREDSSGALSVCDKQASELSCETEKTRMRRLSEDRRLQNARCCKMRSRAVVAASVVTL